MLKGTLQIILGKSPELGYLGLITLLVIGLMNIVHNLTYVRPTDGGVWAEVEGSLHVQKTDLDIDTPLRIGDVLVRIDDIDVAGLSDYKSLLLSLPIGSKHLYSLDRMGSPYEPWVVIRGEKGEFAIAHYAFAFSGFFYLIFLFLILSQNVNLRLRKSLVSMCFFVYLTFVFHHTNRFSLIDWISFFLDHFGGILLPSSMATIILRLLLERSKWLPFMQATHWIPTLLLASMNLYWFLLMAWGVESPLGASFFNDIRLVQDRWSGGLIVLCLLLLNLVSGLSLKPKNHAFFWMVSWLPFGLTLLNLDFPFSETLSGVAPCILPLALTFHWSRRGLLDLGDIGKKVVVYLSVAFVLTLGLLVLIGLSLLVLGSQISSSAQNTALSISVVVAAVSYSPLKFYIAEQLDRLIYGKRYGSIKTLTDFSGMNRADTNIDDFLILIQSRIKNAFLLDKCLAFKVLDDPDTFVSVDKQLPSRKLILDDSNEKLLAGDLTTGAFVKAYFQSGSETNGLRSHDYIAPVRVSGKLAALVIFSKEEDNPKFSPEDYRLLKNLFDQCDVLMENMKLYQSEKGNAARISELKEYNENIIESSNVGILTTDSLGKAVSCNSTLAHLAGLDKSHILKMHFEKLFRRKRLKNQHQTNTGFTFEGYYRNTKGNVLLLQIKESPLKTKENEVYGRLYLIEDIRDKKRIEERMMQQEKLASIGLLAAGVAHEINTPLTGIASYAQFLSGDSSLNDDQKELLDLIQNQSQRAASIVNELLHFSRKKSTPKGPIDLRAVLSQTLRFLAHQVQKERVEIAVTESEQPAMVNGYEDQMQQVFINLIVNAMDAMPGGGKLEIRVITGTEFVEVCFKDSGIGMDELTKSHIFDPFFTTKEVGKGTGLGLAVVYTILQDHGCAVDVESTLDVGTRFQLQFPLLKKGLGEL